MKEKPNVVFIVADQLAPQFLPCYGHQVVKAPTINRLAQEGVVFDSAYTNSPLCAPSRFVMMSGRLPSKIAAWDNAVEFSAEIPTYAHYLSSIGYKTCLSGKMHFVGPDQLHGFEDRLTTDVYPADFTWHPEWDRPEARLDWFHTMQVVTTAGVCSRSMYLDYDDEVVFKAKRWIYDRAREDDGPFHLTVSFIQPHDPYLCRKEKWDLYNEDEIDLPKVPLGSVEEDPHSSRLRYGYGASDVDLSEKQIKNARRAYYGSITDIDDKVGEIVAALEESGLGDNTIIVFTSDHGDMLGERGMWFKMCFFENSARVPLIVHAPKLFAPRRVKNSISLVDLLPTFTDFAGGMNFATAIEGRSLLPHLKGLQGHDEAIGEYFAEGAKSPLYMIRRGIYKLIWDSGTDPVQMYNLAEDPLEVVNVADHPRWQSLRIELVKWLRNRYDSDTLKTRVLESQRRRNFLKKVMRAKGISWDYEPKTDWSRSYVRNNMPIYQLEKRARFPKL